jgi:predicted RNA-binding protein Jag
MFKELDDNLKAMDKEVAKLNSAVEHINQSKLVAEKAVETSAQLQTSFATHLESVTNNVESILQPHKALIKATENLTKIISEIDFPTRLDNHEKELKMIKTLLFVVCGLIVIGTVATIFILKK